MNSITQEQVALALQDARVVIATETPSATVLERAAMKVAVDIVAGRLAYRFYRNNKDFDRRQFLLDAGTNPARKELPVGDWPLAGN